MTEPLIPAVARGQLGQSPRLLLAKAEAGGWWTIAVTSGSLLAVRGWRGQHGRFLAVYDSGSVSFCHWWTTELEAVDRGWKVGPVTNKFKAAANAYDVVTKTGAIREPSADVVVRWTSPVPVRVKVTVTELKRLLVDSDLSDS